MIQKEKLTDTYIKRRIVSDSNLYAEDIPQWLIKAKRQELQLERIIKGKNDGKKQKTSRK